MQASYNRVFNYSEFFLWQRTAPHWNCGQFLAPDMDNGHALKIRS